MHFACLSIFDQINVVFSNTPIQPGPAKTEKQNHAQEKKEKKLVHKEAWENVYASLTYFWDLYNGNVRKEMLIFFRIPFE